MLDGIMTVYQRAAELPAAFWAPVLGVFAAITGSFMNVVIYRLPIMILGSGEDGRYNLAIPASSCPHCRHPIELWRNIPLISYLLLRGRCFHCGERISWRYPLIEAAAVALAVFLAQHYGYGWQLAWSLPFAFILVCILVIDLDHGMIPDVLVLALLGLGLTVNAFGVFSGLASALAGAGAGFLFPWLIQGTSKLAVGREPLTLGHFKLSAAIGAWLGWQALALALIISCVAALAGLAARRPLPFASLLCAAALVLLLWRPEF